MVEATFGLGFGSEELTHLLEKPEGLLAVCPVVPAHLPHQPDPRRPLRDFLPFSHQGIVETEIQALEPCYRATDPLFVSFDAKGTL